MSLYVRLESSFWRHRKTLRLQASIGDAALWIPPRLWSYAAESQRDGDFSDYTADELAMLLAYTGNAQAMLEALQQAGFLDGMRLHDWNEYNGCHVMFHERAKIAAKARWQGQAKEKNQKKKRIEEKRSENTKEALLNPVGSNASSIEQLREQAAAERDKRHAPKQLTKSYPLLQRPQRDYTPEEIEDAKLKMHQLKASLLNQPPP